MVNKKTLSKSSSEEIAELKQLFTELKNHIDEQGEISNQVIDKFYRDIEVQTNDLRDEISELTEKTDTLENDLSNDVGEYTGKVEDAETKAEDLEQRIEDLEDRLNSIKEAFS